MSDGLNDYRRGMAFKAGRKAALAGGSEEACNRERGTIYYDDWHDGFYSGKDEARQIAADAGAAGEGK